MLRGMMHDGAQPPVLLELQGVWVAFGSFAAVQDVGLTLRAGDLLGLVGPNGAGKTTLLRAIVGLQPTVGGTVRIMGETVHDGSREHLRAIGFTPDTPGTYPWLTVRDFLTFIARGYGLHPSMWDESIDFWLEKVWLKDKARHKVRTLSRGMKQRLGIARTLLPNPSVVLLDEPAAGLDPAGRVQFRELLMSLREQGKALIVSSHILADMGEYCSHIGIMSGGRMVKYGTVQEVAHGSDEGRCRYTMELAEAQTGVAELLAGIAGVTGVAVDGHKVVLEYVRDAGAAVALLAMLVKEKVPVASFMANRVDLEEAYMRTGVRQVD